MARTRGRQPFLSIGFLLPVLLLAGCPTPPEPPPPPPPHQLEPLPDDLETMPLEEQVAFFIERLGARDAAVVHEALAALEEIGVPATPYLVRALRETEGRRRGYVARAIGQAADPSAVAELLESTRTVPLDPERAEQFTLEAAIAICRLGSKEGIPILIDLLRSDRPAIRLGAVAALRAFTHRSHAYRYDASSDDRSRAVARWEGWWRENRGTFRIVGARVPVPRPGG